MPLCEFPRTAAATIYNAVLALYFTANVSVQSGDLNLVNGARDCLNKDSVNKKGDGAQGKAHRAELLRRDKRAVDAEDRREDLGRFCSIDSTKSTRLTS